MAKNKKENDIVKTGYKSYRELQQENAVTPNPTLMNTVNTIFPVLNPYNVREAAPTTVASSLYNPSTGDYWGNSIFDDDHASGVEFSQIGDIRADNEGPVLKLAAGIGKGAVLGGTTFLDGTVGLIYGIGSALANIGNTKETGWQTFSRLWDNEISNSLQQINNLAEEWMPNYSTEAEQNKAWYEKLGTVNFWADGVIKNMGFMVGALYSGGAWAKLAKGLGTMGTRILGSTLSAVNEARIEANQNSSQWGQLEQMKLTDAYSQRYDEIEQSNLNEAQKQIALQELDANTEYQLQQIKERQSKVGSIDFGLNVPLLVVDDYLTFGRLYSRGYSNACDIAKQIEREGGKKLNWFQRLKESGKQGLQQEAQEAQHIIKKGIKYSVNKITNKQVLKNALKTGLREGNEEMAQQMAANVAGNLYEADSPDAYYNALQNPKSQIAANDFINSVVKGFNESYGDVNQWEQFAVGAISSLVGMPTFGRVNNSDANTVIGKGKLVGWSGGIIGEFLSANATNEKASHNVEVMNQTVDNVNNHKRYYTQSTSFTNAMDGFSEQNDKFEYANAQDNLNFAAVQAFSNAGRLDEYKELVKQDFENMSEEELCKIAAFGSTKDSNGNITGGWITEDGQPMVIINEDDTMSMSEENQQKMREKLSQKRDKILTQIDNYAKSIQTVRGIGNNSLTDEQEQELAWLDWKSKQFEFRYKEIMEDSKTLFAFNNFAEMCAESINNLIIQLNSLEEGSEERNTLEKTIKNTQYLKSFIDNILDGEVDNPQKLYFKIAQATHLKEFLKSSEILEALSNISNICWLSESEFRKGMQNLVDCGKLAFAANEFRDRYREFVKDPMSIINRRKKQSEQIDATTQAPQNINARERINNATPGELVAQVDEDEDFDLDSLEELFEEDEEGEETTPTQSGKQNIQNARKIIKSREEQIQELQQMQKEGIITIQEYNDAIAMLTNSSQLALDPNELNDLENMAFNDPTILELSDAAPTDPQELEAFQNQRLERGKVVLSITHQRIEAKKKSTENIPDAPQNPSNSQDTSSNQTDTESILPGADPTTKGKSENEKQKEEDKKKKETKQRSNNNHLNQAVINSILKKLDSLGFQESPELYNNVLNLIQELNKLKLKGVPFIQAIDAVKDCTLLKTLRESKEEAELAVLSIIRDAWEDNSSKENLTQNTQEQQKESDTKAPLNITEEEANEFQSLIQEQAEQLNNVFFSKTYWHPVSSELFKNKEGKWVPYWEATKDMKNADGTPKYTEQQINKFKAIHNYLEKQSAWLNAFNLKEGSKIEFVIPYDLAKEAGEPIIIMVCEGKVVGDLPTSSDPSFNNNSGLAEFYNETVKKYEESLKKGNEEGPWYKSDKISQVTAKMIGDLPFQSEYITLDRIFKNSLDGKPEPFKLIIADAQGKVFSKNNILIPLKYKKGQPFVLVPTGKISPAYIAVPVSSDPYNPNINNAINAQIENIFKMLLSEDSFSQKAAWRVVKDQLQKFLYVPNLHIETKSSGLEIVITNIDGTKRVLKDNITLDTLKSFFTGCPYNINKEELAKNPAKSKNYAEILKCNLPVGTIRPINSWFTIAPITSEKRSESSKQPNSLGYNPNAKSPRTTAYTYYNQQGTFLVKVDNINYEVTVITPDAKTITNSETPLAIAYKAITYIKNNHIIPSNDCAKTPWGTYNVKTNKFVVSEEEDVVPVTKKDIKGKKPSFTFGTDGKIKPAQQDSNSTNSSTKTPKQENKEQGSKPRKETKTSDFAKQVVMEISGYFEGGGADIKIDIPSITDEMIEKLAAHFFNNEPFSDEDAKVLLKQLRDSSVKIALESLNNSWETYKRENIAQITSENESSFINTLTNQLMELLGPIASKELQELSKEPNFKDLLKEHPSLSSALVLYERLEEISKEYNSLISNNSNNSNNTGSTKKKQSLPTSLKTYNKVFKALSEEQKIKLLNLKKTQLSSVLQKLQGCFKNGKFTQNVDDIIDNTRNREVTSEKYKPINLNEELAWLSKVLPNLSTKDRVKIVNNLIELSKSPNGSKAWGQFKNGIITISKKAARGTVYHEAFHSVVNTLLTSTEIDTLFEEAQRKYGNMSQIALEERLAEDFRKYVQFEEIPVLGKGVRLFRKIKHFIDSIRGKESYIDNLFYSIQRGQLANRQVSKNKDKLITNRNASTITKEINAFQKQYNKAIASRIQLKLFRSASEKDVKEHIKTLELSDVAYPTQTGGKWGIKIISKKNYNKELNTLKQELESAQRIEQSNVESLSNAALKEQDRYDEELQQHYREKYMYSNLDSTTKEWLEKKGISKEEYEQMSVKEQEVLNHCIV
jgi:hypothetical protein